MMATYHVTSVSYLVYGHAQFVFFFVDSSTAASSTSEMCCKVCTATSPIHDLVIKPAVKNKKAKSSFTVRQLEPAAGTWEKIIQSLRFMKTEDSGGFFVPMDQ